MATLIQILGSADFSAHSVGFIAPVSAGLAGWFFLGGSVAETQQDRAGIADAALAGSPTIGDGYVSFGGYGTGQWLQTQVPESAAFTMLCAARSTETSHTAGADQPMFVSNYGSDAGNGGMVLGASIFVNGGTVPAGTIRLGGGQNNNGTKQAQVNTNLSVAAATSWNFYAGSLADVSADTTQTLNPRKLVNKTSSQSHTTNNYPRVLHSANKMRVGAGFNSAFGGSCDVAFAAFYTRALDDSEVDAIYAAVKARLGARHGIVI